MIFLCSADDRKLHISSSVKVRIMSNRCTWKNSTNGDLLTLPTSLEKDTFATRRSNAIEPVPKVMFIAVVTNGAKIVIPAFRALPANTEDGLLPASIAHCALVLDTCWGTVEDTQIKLSRTPIVCGCPVIPNNNDFIGGFEVTHRANMTLSTILEEMTVVYGETLCGLMLDSNLFAPFPIGSSYYSGTDTFEHNPARPRGSGVCPNRISDFHLGHPCN